MVINGPVAIAGSIPCLFKNNGTKVPINPATTTTATRETEIANAVLIFQTDNHTNRNKKSAKTIPFSVATNISFISLLFILPFTSSFANP